MVREEPHLPTRIMSVAQGKVFERESIYGSLYNRHVEEDQDSNEDEDNEGDQIPKIRIGICAMNKKVILRKKKRFIKKRKISLHWTTEHKIILKFFS